MFLQKSNDVIKFQNFEFENSFIYENKAPVQKNQMVSIKTTEVIQYLRLYHFIRNRPWIWILLTLVVKNNLVIYLVGKKIGR